MPHERDEPRSPLKAILLLRRHEAGPVALSAVCFFLLLLSYYILRPIRETMGVAGGVDQLRGLFLVTVTAMLLLNPVFGWVVSRWPRRVFVPATYLFFAANLAGFYVLLRGGIAANPHVARVFYVWVSVFNLFAVAVFWALMADVWLPSQAKRLFPLIAVGGTIGAISGAKITGSLVEPIGAANLVLVSAFVLVLAAACSIVVGRAHAGVRHATHSHQSRLSRGGAWGGLLATVRSPYLLGICAYMLAYTVTSTLLYFQQAQIVAGYSEDHVKRAEAFADIDLLTNIVALVLQLVITGRVMQGRWMSVGGVGLALAALPVAMAGGFAALAASPTLGVVMVVQALRRAVNYGLAKPARDALYTVLPAEEKYKAKAFIDTFVYRAGDAAGTGIDALLARAAGAAAALAAVAPIAIGIGGAWAVLAVLLGRAHAARAVETQEGSHEAQAVTAGGA